MTRDWYFALENSRRLTWFSLGPPKTYSFCWILIHNNYSYSFSLIYVYINSIHTYRYVLKYLSCSFRVRGVFKKFLCQWCYNWTRWYSTMTMQAFPSKNVLWTKCPNWKSIPQWSVKNKSAQHDFYLWVVVSVLASSALHVYRAFESR